MRDREINEAMIRAAHAIDKESDYPKPDEFKLFKDEEGMMIIAFKAGQPVMFMSIDTYLNLGGTLERVGLKETKEE